MSKPEITLYTTRTCPFCIRAKALLKEKNAPYTEIDVGADPSRRAQMMQRAQGRRTVPQIFIDDLHVGGCDDLFALERDGKLDRLLNSMDAT